MIVSVLGALLCLIGGLLVTRSLVRRMSSFGHRIEGSGRSLEKTSHGLDRTSQELAQGATQSAASLEETVASLEELSSMVKLNTESAKNASTLSHESFEASKAGAESVQRLITSMEALKNSAAKIQEVSQVIDDIAFQTNLLALNASVEAARAGEMGKGFAVVAEAVRSLAQRSAESAKGISNMIEESVQRIHEGSEAAERSGEQLKKFLQSAQRVLEIKNEISSARPINGRAIG